MADNERKHVLPTKPSADVVVITPEPGAGGSESAPAGTPVVSVRNIALSVLAVLATVLVLQYAQSVLIPIVLGTLISYGLAPFVGQAWEEARCRGSRGWRASVSAGRSVAASKGSAGFTRRT